MKNFFAVLVLFLTFLISCGVSAEEHIVERGETALQIALDHNLTMEQLTQLNPGIDLEMMIAGQKLTVPEKGVSFEEFRNQQYGEMLRINDLTCSILADNSALCLFHAENLTELPLYDIRLQASVHGQNGNSGITEVSTALMQIVPGETLPAAVSIRGPFDTVENAEITVLNLSRSELLTASFRIPEETYRQTISILPDGISAMVTMEFFPENLQAFQGKTVNLLAAAYDESGNLTGVRSLYSDFYPRLDITVYSASGKIADVKLTAEVY